MSNSSSLNHPFKFKKIPASHSLNVVLPSINMTTWTQEQVFNDGDNFFRDLERDLLRAKESVSVEIYIFTLDTYGLHFLSLLTETARRGVSVQLSIDGFGSLEWSEELQRDLQTQGVQVRVYHPIHWRLFNPARWTGLLRRINRRDHRKVFVIDREIAYVGSFNISGDHLKKFTNNLPWRDTGVRVMGDGVEILSHPHRKYPPHPLVKLNESLKQRRAYRREILNRLAQAKSKIWITSPYFVPDLFFFRALRTAVKSGRDVRILLPNKNDVLFMKFANQAFYHLLLKNGIRIFEYLPRTLHAKILQIDDWVALGSSNRNNRSLLHDLEVDVVLTYPSSIATLESQFLQDLTESKEIHFHHWINRAWIHTWIEKIILIFKKWL